MRRTPSRTALGSDLEFHRPQEAVDLSGALVGAAGRPAGRGRGNARLPRSVAEDSSPSRGRLPKLPGLVAHRGWAAKFPENTVPAVAAALEAGATWAEVDVQLSSDGRPVLFHDRTLERMCGAAGAVHQR